VVVDYLKAAVLMVEVVEEELQRVGVVEDVIR
jgi:hypothetical protein